MSTYCREIWTQPDAGRTRSFPISSMQALRRRAQHAGIDGFHLHRLRHTAAHRWFAAGGTESGQMAMAGWSRSDMLVRYTRATAAERAAIEALRLDLGNI